MSSFWSIWISVLSLGTLIGCYLLLRWCLTNFAGVEEGESMGHTFDGIEELNNPLPKWWSTFFLLTIIWGFGYLLVYPGLGNWEGLFGWKSSNQGILNIEESKAKAEYAKANNLIVQYDMEVKSADERYGPIFDAFAKRQIKDLATANDDEAIAARKVGQRLFLQNCSQCHGSDARGTTGFPNLTDNDWLYGGKPYDIKHSIMHGRQGQGMIGWETMLGGDKGVKDVAAFVLSLSGREAKEGTVAEGKALDIWQTAAINSYSTTTVGVTNDYTATANSDVTVITSGVPRKPGMSRDDLIGINKGVMNTVGENIKKYVHSVPWRS